MTSGEIVVQRLSTEPKASTMKYSREGTREFVEFPYDELTIDNIKLSCKEHFKENKQCDVLASDQGPSCTRLGQLQNTKLFYVRFLHEFDSQ